MSLVLRTDLQTDLSRLHLCSVDMWASMARAILVHRGMLFGTGSHWEFKPFNASRCKLGNTPKLTIHLFHWYALALFGCFSLKSRKNTSCDRRKLTETAWFLGLPNWPKGPPQSTSKIQLLSMFKMWSSFVKRHLKKVRSAKGHPFL